MFPLKDNIPLARFPIVTVVLVAINVVVYLLEIRHGGSFFGGPAENVAVHYGAIPYELTHPGSHCDLATVPGVEGAASTVACQGMPGVTGSPGPQPATWETAFSSMFLHGSFLHIFGNMLFLVIFGPNVEDATGRLRYLAFYLLGFWFLEQLYFGAAGLASPLGGGEGVAYFAHIGGFAFGLLLIRLFARHRKAPPPPRALY